MPMYTKVVYIQLWLYVIDLDASPCFPVYKHLEKSTKFNILFADKTSKTLCENLHWSFVI